MNYVSFCRMYFSVTHIPVSLMKKNEAIYSSIGEVCSVKAARYWEMAPIDDTPNFYRYSPDIEYGVVHILGTDYAIVLGPAFSVPVRGKNGQHAFAPCQKSIYRDNNKSGNAWCHSRRPGYRKDLSAYGSIYSGMRTTADDQ